MTRRIEIELTSRTNGTYTWRAAGAKQPRGTVDAGMVPAGAAVGDVVRAEIESGLEGLEVVAVLAAPEKEEQGPKNRIEVVGTPQRGPDVSVSYAPGNRRAREGRDREPGRGFDRGAGRRPRTGTGDRGDRPERAGRPVRDRRDGESPESGGPRERPWRDRDRPTTRRDSRRSDETGPRERRSDAGATARPGRQGPERRAEPARRERRMPVHTAHRNELLAGLGPEQLPIAEQLLRGGIPAVRQALAEQSAKQPGAAAAANSDAVLAIAEQLLPRVNLATWKDRATAAQAAGKELRLRELRAVVTASRTVTLDDDARALARTLHQTLDERVKALQDAWLSRMQVALDEGRVAEAMRLAARPPETATRLPAELAVRLAEAAGSAMSGDVDPRAWTELLEATVESPVRRTVKPQGIPEGAEDAARRAAGSVPALARLLGLPIPPPPPPRRPPRVMAGGAGGRAAGR